MSRKCVQENYTAPVEVSTMMETFRQMVNACVRIGLANNVKAMRSLSLLCYPELKKYRMVTQYKLCAISKAAGILKNYYNLKKKGRSVREPYCTRRMLITCYGLSVKKHTLHMPQKLRIRLNPYTLKVLSEPNVVVRSVSISADGKVSISFAKQTEMIKCTGMVGVDRNLNNVTMVDTDGNSIIYDLANATEAKALYRQQQSAFMRNDVRRRKLLFKKYGEIERNRVHWILHNVSKRIVKHAKKNSMAIAMEDIKGIRKLYRKGNGQGTHYRGRMNSWSYYELQRQVEYKALWEGIPVIYVKAYGTSTKCSRCGDRMFTKENRMLECACGLSIDRDINAARNILAKGMKAGVRFTPQWLPSEAMVAESSSKEEVICKVDGGKVEL